MHEKAAFDASVVGSRLHVFANEKPPMAVVTFGSMMVAYRNTLVADIVSVLLERGLRVLVMIPVGIGPTPPGLPSSDVKGIPLLLCRHSVPHDWLFEKAAMVVRDDVALACVIT
jgi:hypothetical protein